MMLFTSFGSPTEVAERLYPAFQMNKNPLGQTTWTFPAEPFQHALRLAKLGEPSDLASLFQAQGVEKDAISPIVRSLSLARPTGKFEAASLSIDVLQSWHEAAILCDDQQWMWLAYGHETQESVTLAPLNKAGFFAQLDRLTEQFQIDPRTLIVDSVPER